MSVRSVGYNPMLTGYALLGCLVAGSVAIERGHIAAGASIMGVTIVCIAIWLLVDVVGGRR